MALTLPSLPPLFPSSSSAHCLVYGFKANQFSYVTFMGRGRRWEQWSELGDDERRSCHVIECGFGGDARECDIDFLPV